jgi:hypothetical protein
MINKMLELVCASGRKFHETTTRGICMFWLGELEYTRVVIELDCLLEINALTNNLMWLYYGSVSGVVIKLPKR